MKCGICGRLDAKIRAADMTIFKTTGRAHVDCGGDVPTHSQYRRIEPHEVDTKFSFCESFTGNGRWHIRKLDEHGMKLGGGITTTCCCGMVKVRCGWDINVLVNSFNTSGKHVNPECVQAAIRAGLEL